MQRVFGGSEGTFGNVIESTLKCACSRVLYFPGFGNFPFL